MRAQRATSVSHQEPPPPPPPRTSTVPADRRFDLPSLRWHAGAEGAAFKVGPIREPRICSHLLRGDRLIGTRRPTALATFEPQRLSGPEELEGLVGASQLYVALAGADGGSRVVAGCVSCVPMDGATGGGSRAVGILEFGFLCVSPGHQRVGLASKLVAHAEAVAQAG